MTCTCHGAQDVDVFAVFPDHIDARVHNTSIVLTGTGFVSGTLCRFGDKISLSTFINQNTIKCAAPARYLAEVVGISVSYDGGRTWSETLT